MLLDTVSYHFLRFYNLCMAIDPQATCKSRTDTFSYLFFEREESAFGSKLGHGVKKPLTRPFSMSGSTAPWTSPSKRRIDTDLSNPRLFDAHIKEPPRRIACRAE